MVHPLRRLSSILTLVALSCTSIVGASLPTTFAQNTCIFTDICDTEAPAYSAVKQLKEQGVLKGNPDGSFRPDAIVNRAEMLTMLYRSSTQELRFDGGHSFKDMDGKAWYAPVVSTAFKQGFVQGYPDGTFRAADGVKTEEAAKMVLAFQKTPLPDFKKGYGGSQQENALPYGIPTDQWFTPYIKTVHDFKLLNSIELAAGLSRADASILMARALEQTPRIKGSEDFLTTWQPNNSTILLEGDVARVYLYFSKPVDTTTLEKSIVVTGENGRRLSNVRFSTHAWAFDNSKLNLTSYTSRPHELLVAIPSVKDFEKLSIRVSTDLKDIYGGGLQKSIELNYNTAKTPVSIEMGGAAYIEKGTQATASIRLVADEQSDLRRVTGALCKVSTDTVLKNAKRTNLRSEETNRYTDIEYLPLNTQLEPREALKPYCQDVKTADLSSVSKNNEKGTFTLAETFKTTLSPGIYFLGAYSYGAASVMGKKEAMAHRLVYVSDTALALKYTKTNPMEGFIWATDMSTNAVQANVKTKVYAVDSPEDGANVWREVAQGETDKDGIFRFSMRGELTWSEQLIAVVDDKEHFGIVGSSWSEGLEGYNYGLSMAWTNAYGDIKNNRIYLQTDRKIYRPGHEVGIRGVVRAKTQDGYALPAKQNLTVAVYDSQDKLIQSFPAALSDQGTFSGTVTLGALASLGEYRIGLTDATPSQEFSWEMPIHSTFQVEEYRRPEFRVTLDEGKKDYIAGETLQIQGAAEYYFGLPVADGRFTWELSRESLYFQPETAENEWFSYADGGYCYSFCDTSNGFISSGEGSLDSNGKLTTSTPLSLNDTTTGGLYTLSVEAMDTNQRTVRGEKNFRVHKATEYVGVRTKEYMVKEGNNLNFEVMTLTQEGLKSPNKSVTLELVREDWTNYAKQDVSGDMMSYNDKSEQILATKTVQTGADARASVSFPTTTSGQYFVRAKITDSKGRTNTAREYSYVYPKDESGYMSWAQEDIYKAQLLLDKPVYSPGDTAQMVIQSPYKEATALISMERGSVIDTMRVDLSSNATPIAIPVKGTYVPNVYISVIIMPKGKEKGLKLAYGTMLVDTKEKELTVALSTDKKTYSPGETVSLDVTTTDANGKAVSADVSVAVVDESIIALAGGVDRDIMRAFYMLESLSVWTAHSLTHYVEQGLIRSVGGSGKGGPSGMPILRGLLKDTAYWNPSVVTDATGKAKVSFVLPDNLTRWEILSVGVTKDTKVGSASHEIDTRQDLVIQPVLPRFFREGDQVALTYTIFNLTDKAESVSMSLSSPNIPLTKNLFVENIPAKGSKTAVWNTTIPENIDAIELVASAQGKVSGDRLITRLPVYERETYDVEGISGNVSGAKNIITPALITKAPIDRNQSYLTLKVSSGLLGSLVPSLEYLLQYPYGCSEQITSAMLGNIVLNDFMKASSIAIEGADQESIKTNVAAALTRLYAYQSTNGGFALWGGNSDIDAYLSAYVLEGMHMANESGFTVDSASLKKLRTYLKNTLDRGEITNMDTKTSVINILRKTGIEGLEGTADTLFRERAKLTARSRAALVEFYHSVDSQIARDRVQTILGEMRKSLKVEQGRAWVSDENQQYIFYYNDISATAAVLEAFAIAAPDDALIPSMVSYLLANRNEGMWSSTHENALILRGLNKVLAKNPGTKESTDIRVQVGGVDQTLNFAEGALSEAQEIRIPLSELTGTSFPVTLTNSRGGTTYYDASISYASSDTAKPVASNGYRITRELLEKNGPDNFQSLRHQLKVGESVFIRLTLESDDQTDGRHIAIEDLLPAGLELLNPRILTENGEMKVESGWVDFYELHDDRSMFYLNRARDVSVMIEARAIAPGTFTYPGARASEMYRPSEYGRTAPSTLVITR